MRDKRTPKDVCGEARSTKDAAIFELIDDRDFNNEILLSIAASADAYDAILSLLYFF